MTYDPVVLLLDALAVFRITKLIVEDSIFDVPRLWLFRRFPGKETEYYSSEIDVSDAGDYLLRGRPMARLDHDDGPETFIAAQPTYFGTWLECVWCVSVWVAGAVVCARRWWAWWEWPAYVAALSAAAGLFHRPTQ